MPKDGEALTDALRLSRGMSYKNAMAGLPLGGGKAVILADEARTKTPDLLHAFGKAVEHLGGRYVTAEDVGMSVADMIEVARSTKFVAGLPNSAGDVGGDPGPHTSLGVFLGIKAAVKRGARQGQPRAGCTSRCRARAASPPGSRSTPARKARRLSIADVDQAKAQKLAERRRRQGRLADEILTLEADVLSPNALGAILDEAEHRCARGAGRRRRRQQPAGDAGGRRAACTSAASSTRPIT